MESFKKELGPFVVAAETTRMAMVFTNAKEPGNPIIFANESFLKLTDYTREEVLAQDFNFLMSCGADAESLERIESRLHALSRAHDLLTRENWESAGLKDILHDALEPFVVEDGRAERIVTTGKDIRFPAQQALALGIAFNELATNAVKCGAFSNTKGSILVEWTVKATQDGKRIAIIWSEKGGPVVTPPSQKGFGFLVIDRGLALELDGDVRLEYRPKGLVCTMSIPAPQTIRHE